MVAGVVRITPLRPIERNGLRGFGFSVHFGEDISQSRASPSPGSGASESAATASEQPSAPKPPPGAAGANSTRSAPFGGSDGEPSIPSSEASSAKMGQSLLPANPERADAKSGSYSGYSEHAVSNSNEATFSDMEKSLW